MTTLHTLAGTPRGTALTYHRGIIGADAAPEAGDGHRDVKAAKADAWALYEGGHALLVQRRVAPCVFDYIAVSTGR